MDIVDKPARNAIRDLAKSTFAAFEPYVNVHDCGVKIVTSADARTCRTVYQIIHSITREDSHLMRQYKAAKDRGEKPKLCKSNGTLFNPYTDYVRNVLSVKHCREALAGDETYYYTSGFKSHGLLYLDVDAHFKFQTDTDKAVELLHYLFPGVFVADSNRGANGLLKVKHYGHSDRFNNAADKLQTGLRRLFNRAKILCDVEVKGTITTGRKSGRLAKLPWRKGFNLPKLDQFIASPLFDISRVEQVAEKLHALADDLDWHQHREESKKAEKTGSQTITPKPVKVAPATVTPTPTITPEPTVAAPALITPEPIKVAIPAAKIRPTHRAEDANQNPDRLQATIDLARLFACQIKRVPTVEELLQYLHDNGFFTGDWKETLETRTARCEFVLRVYVAKHFDANKLKGKTRYDVDVDLWKKWSKQFPETWVQEIERPDYVERVKLTRADAQAYQAIMWTLLKLHPNQDKSIPFRAIEVFWKDLHDEGKTHTKPSDEKIRALRVAFHELDIVIIADGNYKTRKAMRYEPGEWFPGNNAYYNNKKTHNAPKTPRCAGAVSTTFRLPQSVQFSFVPVGSCDRSSVCVTNITHRHNDYLTICPVGLALKLSSRAPPGTTRLRPA
jgi:hypothetical protein